MSENQTRGGNRAPDSSRLRSRSHAEKRRAEETSAGGGR